LRKLATAVFATSLAIFGLVAPGPRVAPASAATPAANPKVVIIVGPVAGSTTSYRSDASAAAAEARKYTTNVITIFSPTATWSKVKPALAGASIVVYMGHGNGWPSKYPPFQTLTKDGLGLNPTAGTDNSTTKYYGESYIDDVTLAPNAVVILGHLCYSAGNSESGDPEPTLSVAKQRVDNMAAGWIKAGARSVVAEPYASGMYGGASYYIHELFTSHQTMDQIFRDSPHSYGHEFTFPSTRSSGMTVEMDPEHVNAAPFRRGMTGRPGLLSADVTGARYAATDRDPTTFVVPGAASVKVDGAGVYDDPSLAGSPSATLALDTRVRLSGTAGSMGGVAVYQVSTLAGSTSGFMSAASLTPRDSQGPNVWTAEDGTGAFSPNGDDSQDTFQVGGQFSEDVAWQVAFSAADGSPVYHTSSGTGATYDATWDGMDGGSPVADGTYAFTVTAVDDWGNPEGSRSGAIRVDTVAPALGASLAVPSTLTFSPNADGVGDSYPFSYDTNEPGFIVLTARNAADDAVRSFPVATAAGAGSASWVGDDDAGHTVPDGTYEVTLAPRDLAGNVGGGLTREIVVYTALKAVKTSHTYFFPQDRDTLARTTALSFTLTKPATVTWRLLNAAGAAVYTRYDQVALAAGTYAYTWGGKVPGGAYAPRGRYTLEVVATDGVATWTQRTNVYAQAFRIIPTNLTPARGATFTISAVSAETLKTAPKLSWTQPGHSKKTVTMTRVSSTTWKATVHLYSSGAGSVSFKVSGTDSHGGSNGASLVIVIH
jgi:flagellar hook assembly protein FlgD